MEQAVSEKLEKKTNCPGCGLAVWYLPALRPAGGKKPKCPKCGRLLLVTGVRITGTSSS